MSTAVAEYLEAKVMTATPHQLHLMIVDAAIRQTIIAEDALRSDDLAKAHQALCQARKLIAEMLSGLDASQAPEVVDNLKSLFLFAYRNLIDGEGQRAPDRIADALTTLRSHRETWLLLGERLRSEETATLEPIANEGATQSGRFSWSS
jgi:flagellar protein FliS